MKYIITFLFVLAYAVNGCAQDTNIDSLVKVCEDQVSEIDQQPLKKEADYILSTKCLIDISKITCANYSENIDEKLFFVYIDSCNRVRKHIQFSTDSEGKSISISYFDINGNLIYNVSNVSYDIANWFGKIYAQNDSVILIDGKTYLEGGSQGKEYIQCGGKIPSSINGIETMKYIPLFNANNWIKNKLKNLRTIAIVNFQKPQIGNVTYINATNVNIRQYPSSDAQITGKLNAGHVVKVIGVSACWNKVSYKYYDYDEKDYNKAIKFKEGYINELFLAPVEHKIYFSR